MLTRFTEPSEIIGPIDIKELREGRYIRRKQGKLPTAKLVFLDEIFKSNSAILNILLTIINEKKFYQDGMPEPVPLRVLFAATNEIPEQGELAALKDRFVLKVQSRPVQDEYFTELIDAGPAGRGVQGAEPEAVGRGPRDARRLPEGEPLPDVPVRAQDRRRPRRGGERPAAVLPGGGVPRVPAAGEDAGARGQDLHQRPQAGEALQAVPRAGVAVQRRHGDARTTCGCSAYLGETHQEIEHLRDEGAGVSGRRVSTREQSEPPFSLQCPALERPSRYGWTIQDRRGRTMFKGIDDNRLLNMTDVERRWLDNIKKAFHESDQALQSGRHEDRCLEELFKAIDTAKTLRRSLRGEDTSGKDNKKRFIEFGW